MFRATGIAPPARRASGIGRFTQPSGLGCAALGAIAMLGAFQFRQKQKGAPIRRTAMHQAIQFTARPAREPRRQRDPRHQ